MGTKKRIYSDLAVPPGEYLAEVLEAKGLTQAELARRIGRPTQALNEIIKGDKALTPATALQLERALDVPAHIWIGLESRYRLVKAKEEEKKLIQKEVSHLPNTPYEKLAELGCVERTRDDGHKVRELHRFYGVSSLRNLPETRAYARPFRYGPKSGSATSYALAAWLRCAEMKAAEMPTEDFSKAKLRAALAGIAAMADKAPAGCLSELTKLLAGCGVVLVLLPPFPSARAIGATFWLRPAKAVLLISSRDMGADIFWARLFHEIGHLLLHKRTTFICGGNADPEVEAFEKEANDFAALGLRLSAEVNE